MASVKQFPGSSAWYACYKMPTGQSDGRGRMIFRRVQRSTGLTDRSRALQLAISYERASMAAAEKRWTEHTARMFLAEVNVLAGVQVAEVEPTASYVARWLKSKKHTVAEKSWKNFSGITGDFLEFLGPKKDMPLIELTPRLVAEFRDAELAAGKAPTTVNKALSILGQLFDEAVATQVMSINPARGLRLKGADRKAQTRQAFTFEQFRQLVRATAPDVPSARGNFLHPDWQTFILAAGYTGGRQQEVATISWENVDFFRHVIRLTRTKNPDDHWMPMHQSLEDHLRLIFTAAGKGGLKSPYVMPHIAKLPGRMISRYFREIVLPRIEIRQPYTARDSKDGKTAGRRLAQYSVHSLRHSLSTWLEEVGVPEMLRMRIVGHEDEDVSRKYTHTQREQEAQALAKVPTV